MSHTVAPTADTVTEPRTSRPCVVSLWSHLGSASPKCPNEAVVLVLLSCPGGHLRFVENCLLHLRDDLTGGMRCTPCGDNTRVQVVSVESIGSDT